MCDTTVKCEEYEAICYRCSKLYAKVALKNGRCDQCTVEVTCVMFPNTFRLRNHEGLFCVSRLSSYMNSNGEVIIYINRQVGDEWVNFAKGTIDEVWSQIVGHVR